LKLSREIKTGIIVIGGILLFILGFSYLKSSPVFDNSITLYAVYDNVGGLQNGTPVAINGFNVGTVKDIRFKDNSGSLLVTFSVDKTFPFSKNSTALLYDTGIIGGKAIQIKPVFDNAAPIKNGDTLLSDSKPGITDLLQQNLAPLQVKIEDAVTNADSLLVNFNAIFDDKTKVELQQSIAGLNELIVSFKGSAVEVNDLLENNRAGLDSSITNVNTITRNFAQLSDSLAQANLPATVAGLQETISNFNILLSKIERGEGSIGKLMHDEELYANLTAASREMDLLLQDFRLNPKRYVNVSVFGKKQKAYTLPDEDPAEKIDD